MAGWLFAVILLCGSGRAQMVPVPFTSLEMGVPAATYNGTSNSACSASTPGYLDSVGDGCLPNQATLAAPEGIATDALGNFYVTELSANRLRIIYNQGANLAAALIAGNPGFNFTPKPGSVYVFGGGPTTLTGANGSYACGGTSGATALDAAGDGCPAQDAVFGNPRSVAVDAQGNIFFVSTTGSVRMIYVAGLAAANLITTYNAAVSSPQPGYIYGLSVVGDFTTSVRDIAIDSNEVLYVSDDGKEATTPSADTTQASTYGNQVKYFTGTGWKSYLSSLLCFGCTAPATANGDGGMVKTATVYQPGELWIDRNNNLYFADTSFETNTSATTATISLGPPRIRVMYKAGPTPPLYTETTNATTGITSATLVTKPVAGDVYTVAGGQTAAGGTRSTGSSAPTLELGTTATIFGLDTHNNLYLLDEFAALWRVDVKSGLAVIIGGNGALTTTGSASVSPAAAVPCNGAAGGPVMTDADADGCPATEVSPIGANGRIAFDSSGNFYIPEQRNTSSAVGIVREYAYGFQFGQIAVGSSATQEVAFTPSSSTVYAAVPQPGYVLTGSLTAEFSDAGSDSCYTTAGTGTAQESCVYNIMFAPSLPGARVGGVNLTASGSTIASQVVGGTGVGALLTLDPGSQTTVGTGLSLLGVGIDQANGVYLSNLTDEKIYKSTAGSAPVAFASGFNHPAQIAVDGLGNVYVADATANRVAIVTPSGSVSTLISTLSPSNFSSPQGVAVDRSGNIFIADTGNNRIIKAASNGAAVLVPTASLNAPKGLAVDALGNLYIADSGNARVVQIAPNGTQTTIPLNAYAGTPAGVAVDAAGDLFVADSANAAIVEVPAGSSIVNILIKTASGLNGLALDPVGNLYVTASGVPSLLELQRTNVAYSFPATNVGSTATVAFNASSAGNASLVFGSPLATQTDAVNFSLVTPGGDGCTSAQSVSAGQSCSLGVSFNPTAVGSFADTVTPTSNAAKTAAMHLTGSGVQRLADTIGITYTVPAGGLPLAGQQFTVTATVTPTGSAFVPSGSVTFSVDGGAATAVTPAKGIASLPLTLSEGHHLLIVTYTGDANYEGGSVMQAINVVTPEATSVLLAVTSPGLPTVGQPFTATATVVDQTAQGTVTGNISFVVDGGAAIVVAVANNSASLPQTLTYGKHTIVATYSGNSYYLTSTNSLAVTVYAAGTASLTQTITSPVGQVTYGQSLILVDMLTGVTPPGTPTGTESFSVDGVVTSTVSAANAITQSLSLGGGTHMLAASYSGDITYAPTSANLQITVARAAPTVTLSITPNVGPPSNSFTLSATVSSVAGTPTGSVSFYAGTTLLGSATLTTGKPASITTTTNALGSYIFSAMYTGDVNFLPVTSTVSPTAEFIVTPLTTTFTAAQGGVALYSLNLSSFYGYTGTISFSCTGATAVVCSGIPSLTTLTADSEQAVQLQVYTDASSNLAGNNRMNMRPNSYKLLPVFLSVIFLIPWRRRKRVFLRSVAAVFFSCSLLSLNGCGSGNAQGTVLTPDGTYTLVVTATDGKNTQQFNVTLTVTGSAGSQRP